MKSGYVVEIRRGNGSPKFIPLSPGMTLNPMSVGMMGDLRLEADGVLDVHGFIYFDGENLFVQSSDGHHQIRVNGKPIGNDWTPVSPPCTLALGDARLVYCPASQASIASAAPVSARPAAGRAPTVPFDESAPTVADLRFGDYDDAVATRRTRAPDEEATGSIPIPPPPPRSPHTLESEDHETTRALPLPAVVMPVAAPAPPPAPPPQVIAAPPPQLTAPHKPKPLDQLKEQWSQASLPKRAIALLLPVAFVMVIFGLDDNEPAQPQQGAPAASASAREKPKDAPKPKETVTEEPGDLDLPKPKASATIKKPPPLPNAMAKEKTAERAAVDAVAAGAWDPAARAYDDLAKQHPENPAFREAARILRAKAKK